LVIFERPQRAKYRLRCKMSNTLNTVSQKQQNLSFQWKENHPEEDQALGYVFS